MKKFLIIGNANAITYNCIFPQIASGEVHIRTRNGKNHMAMYFTDSDGNKAEKPSLWYTNLPSEHLKIPLALTKTYDPQLYPRYDNYNAINVNCVKDIPYDYPGVMGVPISVLLYDIQKDYDVIGNEKTVGLSQFEENGKKKYTRVLIQDSTPKVIYNAKVDDKKQYCRVMNHNSNPLVGGGIIDGKITYKRIPIRKKDAD